MEDGLFFNQSKYVKEMLKKFGLEDSKPTKTPMSTKIKLTKDDEADSVDSSKYQGKKQTALAISMNEAEYVSIEKACNSQVKDNKIDLLVQQYEQFTIIEEESVDSGLLDLTLLLLVLKLLMKVSLARTMLGSFLGLYILNEEKRSRRLKNRKILSSLALDELIGNLKVNEVVIVKDSKIYKGKKERIKSIALKAKKESSDDETSTSGSDDEEYAMAIWNFKKFFRRKSLVTTKEKAQKKNDVKARSMLLMALPNEHLVTFSQYKDAKTLFEAIQARFSVHEDLEQIHEDDLEEIDLKWQLALLSMRARRYFKRTGKKITINGSDTTGYDKTKALIRAIWVMMRFQPIWHLWLSHTQSSGLEKFKQPEFETYGPKARIELKGYLLNDGYADLVQHADKKELAILGKTTTSKEFSNSLIAEEGDRVERAITTDASLEAAQDSDNITKTQTTSMPNVDIPQGIDTGGRPKHQETMRGTFAQTRSERVLEQANEPPLIEGGYTPGSDEGRITLAELMETSKILSNRVTQLETELSTTKAVYNKAFITLTNIVKKLESQLK
uniref:Uncharacterized protein n=1 Tax=Tanacetum cinerariifolium TaxID=118510 RepID=A0A699GWF4_TANCI|nr:hypothetical protein [Tanacetum cinerariifolium]